MSNDTPQSIGIIMDGNRRWARGQGLPSYEGHALGYKKLLDALQWARDAGVKHVTIYALSTENLKRSEEEVTYLFELFRRAVKDIRSRIDESPARVVFAGDRAKFPEDLVKAVADLESETAHYEDYSLTIAAPYGGRAEIVAATNQAIARGVPVNEEEFAELLWMSHAPDPDIIIRTGGEHRLSNFLPWQAAYSELFFVDTLWPEFSQEEFQDILKAYGKRNRRYGA